MNTKKWIVLGTLCIISMSCNKNPDNIRLHVQLTDWTYQFEPAQSYNFPVVVSNQGDHNVSVELHLLLIQAEAVLDSSVQTFTLSASSDQKLELPLTLPTEEVNYEVVAKVPIDATRNVKSRRLIEVKKPLSKESMEM